MPQFVVRNDKAIPMDVVIEPWAGVETLAPKAEILFDYEVPADVSITAQENGDLFVCISGGRIRWIANGDAKTFGAP